ncbi:MAG: thioredoxin domain-containing protein [Gemmatimonadaceae bacterium]
MLKAQVNFSAALAAALLLNACSPANSTPSAEGATTTGTAAGAKPTDAVVTAADKGRIAGDSTAKTWVVIASDFQCPFCKQWHSESYKQFVDEYVRTGKVKVAYINFPLGQHVNAVPTAQGAMCAGAQNRFWQYHDALFESQSKWAKLSQPRPVMDSIARLVGVNFAEWSKCVDSDKMLPLIFADRDRAAAGGVQSTPSFLIGGTVIPGAQPLSAMRALLDSTIARDKRTSSR